MISGQVYLKKEKAALSPSRHPWIFDGALDTSRCIGVEAGIVRLLTHDNRFLAIGTYNPKSAIAFRVLSTDPNLEINENFFIDRFISARQLRLIAIASNTNGLRWINSEGDRLPGLTVDGFDSHLVVQVGTPAMDSLTPVWLQALNKVFSPKSIVRKDSQSVANREHMKAVSAVLYGENTELSDFTENGVKFRANITGGQKTGFFFDQRDNRLLVSTLSKGKRVLDAYSYTGGFGAYALSAEASFVTAVDSSKPACEMTSINYMLNSKGSSCFEVENQDCLNYFKRTERTFDIAVLDPPALAKRRQHLPNASKVYQDIFKSGISLIDPAGGFALACSCSAAVDTNLLLDIVRRAVNESQREAQILSVRGAGIDHPIACNHPEGEYLKSVLLRIHEKRRAT